MDADHLGASGCRQGSLVAHVSDVIILGKYSWFLAKFHIIFRERIIIGVIIGWCIAGLIGRENHMQSCWTRHRELWEICYAIRSHST